MLVECQFENFFSFKEKNTFSMEPASKNGTNLNVFSTDLKKIPELFKTAGVFGPNASGKTNFCKIFAFLQMFLRKSHMNGLDHKMPYTTYALRTENGDSYPQEIIIKFIVKQSLYEYMLKFQDNKILEEYLYFYPISKTASGRKNTLFKRIYQHPKYILEKGDGILQTWSDETIYTRSFLSEIVNNRNCQIAEVLDAYNWLTHSFKIIDNKVITEGFSLKKIADGKGEKIIELIKKADLGLENIKVQELPPEKIIQAHREQEPEQAENYIKKLGNGKHYFLAPVSYHKREDGSLKEFDFDKNESTGTKSFLTLCGPFLEALEKGETILVDEIDMALHPHLMKYLISLFNNSTHNHSNAQLIFTSHAYYLMDGKSLTRDQIWLTSKELNKGFFSDLYSLADMKELKRKNAQFYEAYMNGVYGAIPHLENFYD